MEGPQGAHTGDRPLTVLVTGANSGLGFGICCRLIDEFVLTRSAPHKLHLLFTVRDDRKRADTQKRLEAHLARQQAKARSQVRIEGVLVDLLRFTNVRNLAIELIARGLKLDAAIWNAGMAGWVDLDWPTAVWSVVTDLIHSTTYPTYTIPAPPLKAARQIETSKEAEPELGQIFTANVFGHYLLTHWLGPLFSSTSRIVWVSSNSALPETFDIADLQCLSAKMPYEASKRLTDILVLTSELPATQQYVQAFMPGPAASRPRMFLTHPGVISTSISGINFVLEFFMWLVLSLARFLGSPWHLVDPYKGAISAVWTVLAPYDVDAEEGKGKWGSSTNVWNDERVARTDVEGWGFCGKIGVKPSGCITGSMHRGWKPTNKERREEFEENGRRVWKELEAMRIDWERRLGVSDKA